MCGVTGLVLDCCCGEREGAVSERFHFSNLPNAKPDHHYPHLKTFNHKVKSHPTHCNHGTSHYDMQPFVARR